MTSAKGAGSAARDAVLVGAVVAVVCVLVGSWLGRGFFAYDFRSAYLPAAHAVVAGLNPYPASPAAPEIGTWFIYPPLLAFVLVPVTALPEMVAATVWVAVLLGCLGVALAACRVRDWRCYAATLLWFPTVSSFDSANVSILLALLAALAWRYRDRFGSALAIGSGIAAKLALAPLLVWLLFRGSGRRALEAMIVGGLLILIPWAVIGFAGAGMYDDLLRASSRVQGPESYSLYALGLDAGLPSSLARFVWLVSGIALIIASAVTARRGRDQQSFVLALFAYLAFVPILWIHALVILAVPLAITRPRFGLVWLVPLLMWGAPVADPSRLETARVVLTAGFVLAACLRDTTMESGRSARVAAP